MVTTPPTKRLPYPREYEADVALRDGSTVHVRPVGSDTDSNVVSALCHPACETRSQGLECAGLRRWPPECG